MAGGVGNRGGGRGQPRWPKGTKWGERGPGPGRWREDGKPDAPRPSWAEVASRIIGRGRRRGSAEEEDYYQAQQDSRSAAAGGPRTGLHPHETDEADARQQRAIRREYDVPDDADPEEIGEAIRYRATGGRVGSPGRRRGSAYERAGSGPTQREQDDDFIAGQRAAREDRPADNRESWAEQASSRMSPGSSRDARQRIRADRQRRYREAIERGDVDEALRLEIMEQPAQGGSRRGGLTDEQVRANIQSEAIARAEDLGFDEAQARVFKSSGAPKRAERREQGATIMAEWGEEQRFAGPWYAVTDDEGNVKYGSAAEEWEAMHEDLGGGMYRKIADVEAFQHGGERARRVTTRLASGQDETTNLVRPGDWVVRQPGGEVQVITDSEFRQRYDVDNPRARNRVVTNEDIPAEFLPDDGVIRTPDEMDEDAIGTDDWAADLSDRIAGRRSRQVASMDPEEHLAELIGMARGGGGGGLTRAEVDDAMNESPYAGLSLGQLRDLREQLTGHAGTLGSRAALAALDRLIARKGG